ncbi:MAG: hypothetical protein WCV64_01625, partial [Desulfurivibrionaceae bacterium]
NSDVCAVWGGGEMQIRLNDFCFIEQVAAKKFHLMQGEDLLKIVDGSGIGIGNIHSANAEKKDEQYEAEYRFDSHGIQAVTTEGHVVGRRKGTGSRPQSLT